MKSIGALENEVNGIFEQEVRKTKLSRKSIYQIVVAAATVVVPFAAAGFMATIGAAKDVFEYLVIYHIFSTFMFRIFQPLSFEESDDE